MGVTGSQQIRFQSPLVLSYKSSHPLLSLPMTSGIAPELEPLYDLRHIIPYELLILKALIACAPPPRPILSAGEGDVLKAADTCRIQKERRLVFHKVDTSPLLGDL